MKQPINKLLLIEYEQIGCFFSYANKLNGYLKLTCDSQYNTTFCRAIKFGNGKCGHIRGSSKMFSLFQCILAGTSIEYQHYFMRRIRNSFLYNAFNLG